jgi:hypothetical protein
MSLTARELAILRTQLGQNYRDRLNALIARLRGFGVQGRGPKSGGRGVIAGKLIRGVIESYEWADSETLSDRYYGNTDDFTTQTSTVFDGSYAVECTAGSGNNGFMLTDNPAVETNPGEKYSFYDHSGRYGTEVGFLLESNTTEWPAGWAVEVRHDVNEFDLRQYYSDGTYNIRGSANISVSNNNWYKLTFEATESGDITVVFDPDNTNTSINYSASSNNINSGYFGLNNTNESARVDYIRQVA